MIATKGTFCRLLLGSFLTVMAIACSNHEAGHTLLNGTWKSDREATVQEAFRRDPKWTNASPERVERFKDIFGHMTITYSDGTYYWTMKGTEETSEYKIVQSGPDFVVIRSKGILGDEQDSRIEFVDDGKSYWIESKSIVGPPIREKFVKMSQGK